MLTRCKNHICRAPWSLSRDKIQRRCGGYVSSCVCCCEKVCLEHTYTILSLHSLLYFSTSTWCNCDCYRIHFQHLPARYLLCMVWSLMAIALLRLGFQPFLAVNSLPVFHRRLKKPTSLQRCIQICSICNVANTSVFYLWILFHFRNELNSVNTLNLKLQYIHWYHDWKV